MLPLRASSSLGRHTLRHRPASNGNRTRSVSRSHGRAKGLATRGVSSDRTSYRSSRLRRASGTCRRCARRRPPALQGAASGRRTDTCIPCRRAARRHAAISSTDTRVNRPPLARSRTLCTRDSVAPCRPGAPRLGARSRPSSRNRDTRAAESASARLGSWLLCTVGGPSFTLEARYAEDDTHGSKIATEEITRAASYEPWPHGVSSRS